MKTCPYCGSNIERMDEHHYYGDFCCMKLYFRKVKENHERLDVRLKDKQIIPLIGTFFCVVSFIINEFGFYFGFWKVVSNLNTIAFLPFNLGLYPILASYLIFFIKKNKNTYLIIILMSLFTAFLEIIFVYFGKIIYGNGWNIYFTFFSYFFPYILVYWYYKYLKKLNIIN